MSNPTFSSGDLRAIADMLDGFTTALMKDGDYLVDSNLEYGLDYSDITITQNGNKIGKAVLEDGWIGFQHD